MIYWCVQTVDTRQWWYSVAMPHWTLRVCWLCSACSQQRWVCNFPSPTTSSIYTGDCSFTLWTLNCKYYIIYGPPDKEVVWVTRIKGIRSVVHLPPSQRCTVSTEQSSDSLTTSPLHTIKAVPVTNCCFTSHQQPPPSPPPSQRTPSQATLQDAGRED